MEISRPLFIEVELQGRMLLEVRKIIFFMIQLFSGTPLSKFRSRICFISA